MSITDHPAFAQGYSEMQKRIASTVAPISEAVRRWESEQYMLRTDPLLAKLYRAEAISSHRAENNVSEAAKLPMIRDLLREIIELRTGRSFKNPLFP